MSAFYGVSARYFVINFNEYYRIVLGDPIDFFSSDVTVDIEVIEGWVFRGAKNNEK
jgi:hypothetical protein